MSSGVQTSVAEPGAARPFGRSWWRRNAVIVVASVLIGAGAVVFLLAPTKVPFYGWTAYTPLTSGPEYARTSYTTGQHLLGAAITAVGLIALAAAIGGRLAVGGAVYRAGS